MENNIENTLIAGGLLGLISMPFLVINYLSKKKIRSGVTAKLTDLAHKAKSQISHYEQLGAKAIGLDKNTRTILFVDTNETSELIIDLAKIKACKLLKKMNAAGVGSIELQLRDENNTLLYVVPFYRRFIDDESYLSAVFKVAEKWRQLIYNLINNQR